MNQQDDDILEILKLLEEKSKQEALEKQLKELTLDPKLEQKGKEQEKKKLKIRIKKKTVEEQQIKVEEVDNFSNSKIQDSLELSNVRLKREKVRENLRKEDLESKFKIKREIKPILSELKEVEEDREEDTSNFKQEQVTKMQKSEVAEQEEIVVNVAQEEGEQQNKKETQKKRRAKSRR